jgi:dienelactone hydrolase
VKTYFHEFGKHDFRLVTINPNLFGPDIEGDSFIHQLERVISDIAADKKICFIGFSMGGKILVEFLQQRSKLPVISIPVN